MGDGAATFLWHDSLNPVGPLLPFYGEWILYDSAIHSNARVAEVIDEGGGGGGGISLSLIQVTLLLSKTVVPIIISMLLERILSLGLLIHQGFSLLALSGTTLDLRCRWLIGTARFGFPKPSGDILSLSG